MNEQNSRQGIFGAFNVAPIPYDLQIFAAESVRMNRDNFAKISVLATNSAKTLEDTIIAARTGAKSIGDKIICNFEVNTESAFDAARAISQAKTLPEVVQLQTSFMQNQLAVAGVQTQEFLELSTKVVQQTIAELNALVAQTFEATIFE